MEKVSMSKLMWINSWAALWFQDGGLQSVTAAAEEGQGCSWNPIATLGGVEAVACPWASSSLGATHMETQEMTQRN